MAILGGRPLSLRLRTPTSVRAVTVIEVVSVIGRGSDDDPCRKAVQYWSFEGGMLAERDTLLDPVSDGASGSAES